MNNQDLERRIKVLEKWKEDRIRQQIVFPLDFQSIEILKRYFMHLTTVIEYDAGAGGNHFVTFLGQQGSDNVTISSYPTPTQGNPLYFQIEPVSLVQYSVNITTDYLTTIQSNGNVKFFDGTAVVLITEGTAPSPLSAGLGITYYVRDSDGYTFKLSATLGGAAINITTTGSGKQFITLG